MLRSMHLFAGGGGGLLADLILGHEPVCAVELDPKRCAGLERRAREGWFPGLHVHCGDVGLFDPSPWAGRVDCIHAGFPCQDISVAGNGAGIDGERSGLYREVLRIADVVRPRFIFMENSPAIVGRGLGSVLRDVATRGGNARWTVLAASDVGAPHQRERWWCLAEFADAVRQRGRLQSERFTGSGDSPQPQHDGANGALAGSPADIDGLRELQPQGGQPVAARRAGHGIGQVPDALCQGLSPSWTNPEGTDGFVQRGPASDRGWWTAEPGVGRVVHGMAHRVHRIETLGDGQVPLCAATAWRILGGP